MNIDWYHVASLFGMVASVVATAIAIYLGIVFVIGGWG